MPKDYLQPSTVGCAYGLVGLGSLIVGIYHGLADAKGTPIDKGLDNILLYAPTIAGVIIGPYMGEQLKDHPAMDAKMAQVPPEARGCVRGVNGVFAGAATMTVANCVGYGIGRYILGNLS